MAQQKNSPKTSSESKKPQTQKKNNDDPKTFGKEPPMEEPKTPEHPDQYEVSSDENRPDQDVKPTLH